MSYLMEQTAVSQTINEIITGKDFQPIRVIVLSELTQKERERYYSLLIQNQSKFRNDDHNGRFLCDVRYVFETKY